MSSCDSEKSSDPDGFFDWIGYFQKIWFIFYCFTTSEQQDIVGAWYNDKLKVVWAFLKRSLDCLVCNGDSGDDNNNNRPDHEIEDRRRKELIMPMIERLI